MPDEPEDVGIELAHELFDRIGRGTLAEVGIGRQHAGSTHFLRLIPVREQWSNGRAAEDCGESPTILQLAGGELWLRRRHRFLFLLLELLIVRSFLVLKVVGVGHRGGSTPRRVHVFVFLLHALSAQCTVLWSYPSRCVQMSEKIT